MTTKNYFVRNPDGSLKTKQPCQTPGCNWPNFHVCLVGKEDTFPKLLKAEERISTKRGGKMSDLQKASIAESQRARHAARYAANYGRDMKIQGRYDDGISIRDLAAEFHLSRESIRKALARPVREIL